MGKAIKRIVKWTLILLLVLAIVNCYPKAKEYVRDLWDIGVVETTGSITLKQTVHVMKNGYCTDVKWLLQETADDNKLFNDT